MSKIAPSTISMLLVGAVAVTAVLGTHSARADDSSVALVSSVPYAEDNNIRKKITNECTALGSKLAKFTESYAKKNGVTVQLADSAPVDAQGRVLQMEITDAVSTGNAFIGHRKYVQIEGTLWENGQQVASFEGQRTSGGGALGGYKSSCSVLGRCVKALGKDVAAWLANPEDDASLGD